MANKNTPANQTPQVPSVEARGARDGGSRAGQDKDVEAHSASNWALAEVLRERYPAVFRTKGAAKQVVDVVFETAKEIIQAEGRFCLRGIGTISVAARIGQKVDRHGRVRPPVRRRLSITTSWAMLSLLNPEHPKHRKKG